MPKKSLMVEKNPMPAKSFASDKISSPAIGAYLQFSHLKNVYRKGWLKGVNRDGIIPKEKCESDADHVFGVAALSMIIADEHFPELDKRKLLEMALVHEMGEAYAGDIGPNDGISLEEKFEMEEEGMIKIFAVHPQKQKYLELWKEFEEGKTPEARFVKQMDRMELAMQALTYEAQTGMDLTEFFDFCAKSIHDGKLKKIFSEVLALRKK